jgi:hypothetical protein
MTIGSGPPPPDALITDLIEELSRAAIDHSKRVARRRKFARRKRTGGTRRPGVETPLWNAMVARIQPHLVKRGAKSNLARVLGLPRQRIYDTFTRRSIMPDAECVLHLLLWLAAQESRIVPGRHGQPIS